MVDTDPLKPIKDRGTWMRLLYMLLFAAILYVTLIVTGAVVVIQFLFKLVTGTANGELTRFGGTLADFVRDVVAFLTFASETMPFPFAPWPAAAPRPAPARREDGATA